MPLDEASVRSLRVMMGPWFVLDEHTPTAPGVTWEKFLSLIEKGKITPTAIVRGPATAGLWRPAGRAPSVATRLGVCWACQKPLPPDDGLVDCPKCGRKLNGPVHWPETAQAGAASEPDEPADDDALDDLIEAGAGGTGGAGYANDQDTRPGSRLMMVAVVIAAAVCGLLVYAIMKVPGPAQTAPPPSPASVKVPENDRPHTDPAQPGELFPEVPYYGEPTPPKPSPGDPRRLAQARFDQAQKHLAAGDLMAAQDILVDMITTHDPEVVPAGAQKLLKDTRKRILASQPATGPSKSELDRQRISARKLFQQAEGMIARGDLVGAQRPLLKILNTHHPKAWPARTMETFKKVRQAINAGPASQPDFFGIESRK